MTDEEGLALIQLLVYVERAVHSDMNLHVQLLGTMRQLANHSTAPGEERALGEVLISVLLGEQDPDLGKLPPEAAEEVRTLLVKIKTGTSSG